MQTGSLLAAVSGALSILSLGVAVMVLRGDGASRQLEARIRSIARPTEAGSGTPRPHIVDIRRPTAGGSAFARLLARLGRSSAVPPEWRVSWVVVLAISGVAVLGVGFGSARVLGLAVAPFAAVLAGALTVRAVFGFELQRYRSRIFVQIPEALGLILRAIRAGLPMGEALSNVAREIASPSREEFRQVVSEISIGQPVDAALSRFAERIGLAEYYFFAVTVGLQASTGGNLGETLENLAEMVRKRVAMAGRVKALTAEARLSALILGMLPFVAGGGITLMKPDHLMPLFTTDTGQQLLLIGTGMLITGLLVIRGLLRSAVKD